MNLDDVLREPTSPHTSSLIDHSWFENGLVKQGEQTYDPVSNENGRDNNKKDDLEMEWGYGTIEPFYSNGEDDQVPAGAVSRNLPPSAYGDAGPVILFARDLMNRGFMGAQLQRRMREQFDQNSLKFAASGLRDLFSMEGIIGCIAVDVRGYDSPKQAIASTQNNPNKHFIKYIIAAPRDKEDYLWLPDSKGHQIASEAKTSGNAIDDFFGASEAEDKRQGYQPKLVPHCKQTMLPIFAGMGDLDESELDETLIELMNVGGLSGDKHTEIVNNDKYGSRLAALQDAFRWLNRSAAVRENTKYQASVDATEFLIKTRDQEIELVAEVSMPELDIDPVNHCLQNQFEINPERQADSPLDVSIFGEMTDVILAGQPKIDALDVRQAEAFGTDIPINQARVVRSEMQVQEREIDGMSVLDESMLFRDAHTPEVTGLDNTMTVPVDRAPERRGEFDLFEEPNQMMDRMIDLGEGELHIAELDAPYEVELDASRVMDAALDVDMVGGEMAFGLVDELVAQDVSMAQHEDPMFVGTDIEFNERTARPGELDIELGSSMEW